MTERLRRLFAAENVLMWLLVFVPVAAYLGYFTDASGTAVFITSAIAIIPLAGLMGRATEQLAEHVGAGLGGLLNATFGNAAELIIAIIALNAGLHDLVKASITGSIIGNILLVFGLASLLGGLKYPVQTFNRTAAGLGSTLLVLSAIGLVIPATFHALAGEPVPIQERELSLEIAIVLVATYGLSLLFSLRTHSHLYAGEAAGAPMSVAGVTSPESAGPEARAVVSADAAAGPVAHAAANPDATAAPDTHARGSAGRAFLLLLVAAAFVGWMSELLVGAVEEAAHALGMSEVFVGVILVALVGNAAEHSTAVLVAMKDKMDLAIHIAIGSSMQIALFVAPVLVFLSYFVGPQPMDLRFTTFEVVAVALSVGIMALIALDGESHWMEGVQLLAVYLILGIAFFFLPV